MCESPCVSLFNGYFIGHLCQTHTRLAANVTILRTFSVLETLPRFLTSVLDYSYYDLDTVFVIAE